ncbi:MAG: squalene/phytoene synthase family protein, partial [Verrucomicrobiota bacterium]
WTKVGYENLGERFADLHKRDELLAMGRNFGQGLQLVNIIRDLHEDLPIGRHYLPKRPLDEKEWLRWIEQCRKWLKDGISYATRIRSRRVAWASVLPALIGMQTITKLEQTGFQTASTQRIKVGKPAVFRSMLRAVLISLRKK